MDAMTPDGTADRNPNPVPTALRLLGEAIARQTELGIQIELTHMTEEQAHRDTRFRLSQESMRAERISRDLKSLQDYIERVREALSGTHITGEEPPAAGDLLAEARELWSRFYNMEAELFAARTLLEKGLPPNEIWHSARRDWFNRVDQILNPELEPDGVRHPAAVSPVCNEVGHDHDGSSCQGPRDEEAKGESHS